MKFNIEEARNQGFKNYFESKRIKDVFSDIDYSNGEVKFYLIDEFKKYVEQEDRAVVERIAVLLKQKFTDKEEAYGFEAVLRQLDTFIDKYKPIYEDDEDNVYVKDYKLSKAGLLETYNYLSTLSNNEIVIASYFSPSILKKSINLVTLYNHKSLL